MRRQLLPDDDGTVISGMDTEDKSVHEGEEEVSVMCNLSKGIEDKGIAKGIARGRVEGHAEGRAEGITSGILSSIKNLTETLGLSIEQAMVALKVLETDRQKYIDLLNQ